MLVFFFFFSFFSFVTSSRRSTWSISLSFFFFFFVPSLMPCFHVTTLSPLHPMLQRLRLGFVAGWALGRFRSIWFGSGRYLEQFTDTTTGVCEGFFALFHGSLFLFPLFDSIPSVTRCQKCTNLAGCLLLEMVQGHSGILLYSFQHITYRLVLGINPRRLFFPGLISGRTACLVGLETSLLSLLLFFCFLLMINVCPLGSDDSRSIFFERDLC